MRKNSIFWALVLILVGAMLLLDNLGVLSFLRVSLWGLIGPLFLILLGVRLLLRVSCRRPGVESKEAEIPLGSAERADVHIHHGAGRLHVAGGAPAGTLAAGAFAGGLDYRTRQEGDRLYVDMHVPTHIGPLAAPWQWGPGKTLDWNVALTGRIPLRLDLETGANETMLDLQELQVTELKLKTGASSTEVTLPAKAGCTRVKVEAGVASVKLIVPGGVAARIRSSGALAGNEVDTVRFPRTANGHESVGYDTAENRVEIDIHSALGSVEVR